MSRSPRFGLSRCRRMRVLVRVWLVGLLLCLLTSVFLLASSTASLECPNDSIFSMWTYGQRCSSDPMCTLPPLTTLAQERKQDLPPVVHIAVVACGERVEETLVSIKSAVILSTYQLHFHIFADDDNRPQFRKKLKAWPESVRSNFDFSIYPITYPPGEDAEAWRKLFKPCATQRLFIPYVIPENVTDALLYVDTDILFMRPVEQIWNFFTRFNSSQIAALAPEHEWDRQGWYNRFARHPYYGPRGVNSGVMLMNLTRMREAKWIEHIIPYHNEYKLKITWGDQDLINIFFHYFPDKLYVYPCHWNFRPDHCIYGLNCVPARDRGVSVVHGNRGVYHNEKQVIFRTVYNTFKNFKFGKDLESDLLEKMKDNIDAAGTSGDYCYQVQDVFTAQLERQLDIRQTKCKQNKYCDIDTYQPEDFSFEPAKEQKLTKSPTTKKKSQKQPAAKKEQTNTQKPKESKKMQNEKPIKDLVNEALAYEIVDTLLDEFTQIKRKKLLPILKEHLVRTKDALDRHQNPSLKPQEIVDEALLPGDLHENIIGFLQGRFEEMDSSASYVKTLEMVVGVLDKKDKATNTDKRDAKQIEKKEDAVKDEIHIAVVACGDRLEEPLVMMKSALLFSKKTVRFHLFAEQHLQPQFRQRVAQWPDNVRIKLELSVYDIQYPPGQNEEDWKKLFKKCATQRLFIPDLLQDVDSLLYVDTDILFLRPVDDIWHMFSLFNSTQISGLAPEHEDAHVSWYKRFARHPYYPPLGVNSGVMLMNLTRMRAAKWSDHIVPYYHTYRYNTTWGDQDLINIYFHFFPEQLYIFPCDWNYRQDHCMYMHVCKTAETNGVSVLHGARQVYHNEKELSFKAVYQVIRDYEFGGNLKKQLHDKIRDKVEETKNTNCGKVGWVLTKQLEKQIQSLQDELR